MDIHHANMIRNTPPERVYEALTQPSDLQKWWGVPTTARAEVGSIFEFQFPAQPRRTPELEVPECAPNPSPSGRFSA